MSSLILLAIALFSPAEALVGAFIGLAVIIVVLGVFFAPAKVWIVAVLLIPTHLVMVSLLEDLRALPEWDSIAPMVAFMPTLAAVTESLAAILLTVLTTIGLVRGRPIGGVSLAAAITSLFRQSRT